MVHQDNTYVILKLTQCLEFSLFFNNYEEKFSFDLFWELGGDIGNTLNCPADPAESRAQKSAPRTSRFSFRASNFLFPFAQWTRDQSSCLPS